jgi:alanyl-tRNA synthetase
MKQLTANELRQKYIDFFVSKGHKQISGASLIPENDPTVLFTTAGMHPLVPFILGAEHPAGKMLCDYQKCIRTGDIDEVGDPSHLTFFEMLGNWSLGAYFKKEAIAYSYEFLTQVLGIDQNKLSVTVFAGDDEVPRDNEAAEAWMSHGIPKERIYFLPREDNWWGPAGETGPCGPDSEMFIDTGAPACALTAGQVAIAASTSKYGTTCSWAIGKPRKASTSRWNASASTPGMGIERTITILQGKKSVYETEVFTPILEGISKLSGVTYGQSADTDISMRIIADHIRTAVFILGDEKGMAPSNVGQGYILRRLIRRAVRHGHKLGMDKPFLCDLAPIVLDLYGAPYPELLAHKDFIFKELQAEEEKFEETLVKGEREFEKMLPNLLKDPQKRIGGRRRSSCTIRTAIH